MKEAVSRPAGDEALDRLRVAHGVALLGWGIGAFFLLATGAMRIPALDRIPFPAYVFALLVVYAGFRQTRAAWAAERTDRVWRRARASLLVLLYLSPFFSAWLRVPHSSFFLIHVFLVAAAGMWLLYEVNRINAQAARRLGHRALAAEVDLSGLIVLSMTMTIPVLAGYAVWKSFVHTISFFAACFDLLYHTSRLWLVPAMLPISLTLAACWRVHRAAVHRVISDPE